MTYSPEETNTSLKTSISPEDQRVEDSISFLKRFLFWGHVNFWRGMGLRRPLSLGEHVGLQPGLSIKFFEDLLSEAYGMGTSKSHERCLSSPPFLKPEPADGIHVPIHISVIERSFQSNYG